MTVTSSCDASDPGGPDYTVYERSWSQVVIGPNLSNAYRGTAVASAYFQTGDDGIEVDLSHACSSFTATITAR